MQIFFLTIFPNLVECLIQNLSLFKRGIKNGLFKVNIVNIRDFAYDKHKQVDDYVYGKRKGMLLRFDVVYRALDFAKSKLIKPYTILPSPKGKVLDKYIIKDLSRFDELIFICPNYEGIDSRILRFINEEVSIGDYVISSAELAAFVILESILRVKFKDHPNSLVNIDNLYNDSFNFMSMDFLLEPPQYTRPKEVKINSRSIQVESYCYSGEHLKINQELLKQAIEITIYKRPDIFKFFMNRYRKNIDKKILIEAMFDSVLPS